jgi:DNA repair protein RecO (recombination protein O)
MQSNDLIVRGLVLRASEYKEADAMVRAISDEGFFDFSAKGVKKLTSKNAGSVQPFSYSEFDLIASSSHLLSLKKGTLIENYAKSDDERALFSLLLIQELTLVYLDDEEAKSLYPYLLKAVSLIKDGHDPLSAALIYMIKVIDATGFTLQMRSCAVCGEKKDIVGLSFFDGGLICRKHSDSRGVRILSPRYLNIVRFCFLCKPSDMERASFEKKEACYLMELFGEYIYECFGKTPKTMSMIEML